MRRFVIGGAALVAAVAGGAAWWLSTRQAVELPPVPELPAEMPDPQFAKAAADAHRAATENPRSAAAWGQLGKIFHARGRAEAQTLVCYRAAAALDPDDGEWDFLIGFLTAKADPAAAVPSFRAALNSKRLPGPEHRRAVQLALADALYESGQPDEAETLYRAVYEADPRNPRAALRLAQARIGRGDDDTAARILEPFLDHPVIRQRSHAALAGVYRRKGDEGKAADFERLAAELPPESSNWPDPFIDGVMDLKRGQQNALREVNALLLANHPREAVAAARKLAEDYPSSLSTLTLSRALVIAGRPDEAVLILEELLRREPDLRRGHAYLAFALFLQAGNQEKAGSADAARATYERSAAEFAEAVKTEGGDEQTYLYYGRCLAKLGRTDEAAKAVEKFTGQHPTNPDGFRTLSELYRVLGRTADADRAAAKAESLRRERPASVRPAPPR